MSSCRYNIPEELVYRGGDVIIHTGAKKSGVFLIHSAILRKNSHFFETALSGIWRDPVQLMIDGVVRKVWEFEMIFDHDTQLPLLKPLQDPINPHRHIMPENATANKSFTKQWATTDNADQFRILLNTHVSLAHVDVYVPPRQFSCTDAQPTKHATLKYFPEYIQPSRRGDDEGQVMPARLETYGHASTYGPFFDGHIQFLPAFGCTRDEHHDMWFNFYPTHEATRRHLQAMWSMLLRAFYNLTTYQGGRNYLAKNILLIANTATLANYYGALDSVRWTLAQMVYQDQPGVWKLIAEQPRFFLVLGYRLKCMDIFIDAVKHLAGRMAFGCMLRPHVFRLNAPSDLSLKDYVPDSVINLIEKASKEIEAHYLDTLDRLNDALDVPLIPGSEQGPLQHIACYRIAKFLNGRIMGSRTQPGDFGDEAVNRSLSAGPRMIRLLWSLQADRDLTAIDLALQLADAARVFNQDLTALCRASLVILESHPVYTFLEEFVNGTKQVSLCRECKESSQDPEPVYHSESQTKQLCPRHGHKAMHHAVDYDTNLKTWAVTEDIAEHKDTDWIPSPDEFYPDIPSFWAIDGDVVARQTVTVEELRQLGLLDSFTVRTDRRTESSA